MVHQRGHHSLPGRSNDREAGRLLRIPDGRQGSATDNSGTGDTCDRRISGLRQVRNGMWEEREESEQLGGWKCQELRWAQGQRGEWHVPVGPAGLVVLWRPSDGKVRSSS